LYRKKELFLPAKVILFISICSFQVCNGDDDDDDDGT